LCRKQKLQTDERKRGMITRKMLYEHAQLLTITGGGTSEEVLMELGEYAVEHQLAREGFPEALLRRERQYPTGIQGVMGVAIPHSDQEYTKETSIVIALLEEPVSFRPMGGGGQVAVKVIFMLLLNKQEHQVEVLENIVGFIQDERKLKELWSEDAPARIYAAFGQYLHG
jgi:PTS system galactitol-specific IIA component